MITLHPPNSPNRAFLLLPPPMSQMRNLRHNIATTCLAQVITAQQGRILDVSSDLEVNLIILGGWDHSRGSHIWTWERGPSTLPSRFQTPRPAGQSLAPTKLNKQTREEQRTVVLSGTSGLFFEQVKHAPATLLALVIGSVSPWVAAVDIFSHPALTMEPGTLRGSGICAE